MLLLNVCTLPIALFYVLHKISFMFECFMILCIKFRKRILLTLTIQQKKRINLFKLFVFARTCVFRLSDIVNCRLFIDRIRLKIRLTVTVVAADDFFSRHSPLLIGLKREFNENMKGIMELKTYVFMPVTRANCPHGPHHGGQRIK